MGYEAVRARLNLSAVLPNLEDVVRYDPEAAKLIEGARVTIQFIVAGGPKAYVRIADGACTVADGMAPGVRPGRAAKGLPGAKPGRGAKGGPGAGGGAPGAGAASAGAGADASTGASPGAVGVASSTGADGSGGKEATVVLGFASCAHLNKMFDGKGNPIPLWGFTKLKFLTGAFTKLTERMAYFLKPTDELLKDPDYLALNTRLTLNTAAFAVPVLLAYDPDCKHLAHVLHGGSIGVRVLPDGPSVSLLLGPGAVRPVRGDVANPSGLILMRDLQIAGAYLNGKLDTFSAAAKGEVQVWGQIGKIEAVGLVLDRVPKYLS